MEDYYYTFSLEKDSETLFSVYVPDWKRDSQNRLISTKGLIHPFEFYLEANFLSQIIKSNSIESIKGLIKYQYVNCSKDKSEFLDHTSYILKQKLSKIINEPKPELSYKWHKEREGFIIVNLETAINYVEMLKNENVNNHLQKLIWNGSPSLLGYLITELANRGFIEYPLRGGEPNYAGLAKQCFEIFELDTTLENIKKEFNPNKNTLSPVKRSKFKIPELKDLK